MIEYLLTAIIIAQIVFLYLYDRATRKERADLILQIISKNLTEYVETKEELEEQPERVTHTETPKVDYRDLEDIGYDELVGAKGF